MRCPRCQTKMPEEATQCPDCDLPKPKRVTLESAPKVIPEEARQLDTAEILEAIEITETTEPPRPVYAEKVNTAKVKPAKSKSSAQTATKPVSKQLSLTRNRLVMLIGLPLLICSIGAVVYWFVLPLLKPEQIEPQTAMMAINRFRQMPSNEQGLTVDDRMRKELDEARRNYNLRGYQGWTTTPVKGDKNKVLIAFSFEQKDNKQRRAEWIADIVKKTYTPQNELAAAIYKR